MEITMKLAINTYAQLNNKTFNEVLHQMQTNKLVRDSVIKLMFCAA